MARYALLSAVLIVTAAVLTSSIEAGELKLDIPEYSKPDLRVNDGFYGNHHLAALAYKQCKDGIENECPDRGAECRKKYLKDHNCALYESVNGDRPGK